METVFDPRALDRLGLDAADRAFAGVFAQKYRDLLASRISRIEEGLRTFDLTSAMDATLSLKVSSSTVGAVELAATAERIERAVRRQDLTAARREADSLPESARRTLAVMDVVAAPRRTTA